VPIGEFIVDFACLSVRLVIEIDGGQHNAPAARADDQSRDARLRDRGYHMLRFWNSDVMRNLDGVMEVVYSTLINGERTSPPRLASLADPPRPRGG
jgi:very-short-patch-repair endonuclease